MRRIAFILVIACAVTSSVLAGTQTRGYNWDNGSLNYWVTGPSKSNASASCPANIGSVVSDPDANKPSNKVLQYIKATGSTESLYLVHVEGLLNNDVVTVSYKMRNGTTSSLRIWGAEDHNWGHGVTTPPDSTGTFNNCSPYTFNYSGLSTGPAQGTAKTWFTQSYAYTFKTVSSGYVDATGMLFEVRYYGGAGNVGYVDDIQVTCPDYCAVTFPDGSNGYDVAAIGICTNPPFGDINYDCKVDFNDMSVLAKSWLVSDINDVTAEFGSTAQHLGYGWQDMGSVTDPNLALVSLDLTNTLNTFGFPGFRPVASPSHDTPYSLECTQGNLGTGELYVAKITGLSNGDKVAASIWLKSGTGQGKVRLWSVYTSASTGKYAGSAGGDEAYSQGDWKRFSHEWTFDEGSPSRGGMVIEVRTYGNYRDIAGYADDLVISAPAGATVTFPNGNLGSAATQAPVCGSRPAGDLNVDCTVNMADFALMAADWLKCGLSTCN